jgi:hypothetical protein
MPFSGRRAFKRPCPERPQIILVILGCVEVSEPVLLPHFHLEGPRGLDQGDQGIFPSLERLFDPRDEPPRVYGEEGFREPFWSDGDDDIPALGPPDERPQEPRVDIGDVAGEDGTKVVLRDIQSRQDPGHGALARLGVLDDPPGEGARPLAPGNGDEDLLEKACDLAEDVIDKRPPGDAQAGLVGAHPHAFPPREDDQRDRMSGAAEFSGHGAMVP